MRTNPAWRGGDAGPALGGGMYRAREIADVRVRVPAELVASDVPACVCTPGPRCRVRPLKLGVLLDGRTY